MTVFDNVAYPLESRGTPRSEIAPRVNDTLALVGIANLTAQYPAQISGGQQQRVALARALVGKTSVVLFDEPLSSVDAKVREQLRIELKRMQQKIRFSGLYVTHDQTEAMELGDRVAVLESGRIAALGDPRSIYEHPPSEYVANFVGAANIWQGRVVRRDANGLLVQTGLGEFLVETGNGENPLAGSAVKILVRPEKFRLSKDVSAEGPNSQRVRIETCLFAGPYTEVLVSCGTSSARVWIHDEAQSESPREGSDMMLLVEPDKIRILPDTGG
jgi:iron(III) transport system ATP-binding protein